MARDSFTIRRVAGLALPALLCLGAGAAVASGKSASPAYTPSGAWEAFFRNDKGVTTALLLPPERNQDKDWLFLQFTDYKGPRLGIAIMGVENKTAAAEQAQAAANQANQAPAPTGQTAAPADDNSAAMVPVSALEDLLTTAMINIHHLKLLDSKAIGATAAGDAPAAGHKGRHPKAAAPKAAAMPYLLFAVVNDWTPDKNSVTSSGSGKTLLERVGLQKSTAEVTMTFRIADGNTRQVLYSTTERATAGSWGISLNDSQGNAAIGLKATSPIGYAVQACINKGAYKLAMWLKDKPWSGAVVKIAGDKVYLNAGSNDGISPGLTMTALARGTALKDPITGKPLGETMEAIGTLQVTEVRENYAVASVLEGCKKLKAGDQVELRPGK